METIFNKYKNGEISRFEAYKLLGEKMDIETSKVQNVYERYFKPSEESCSEQINQSCKTFTNYTEYEDEAFLTFVYSLVNNEEKVRQVKELSTTI